MTVKTRELIGTGRKNRVDLFYEIKSNTFKEHATLDLILPTFFPEPVITIPQFARITVLGDTRQTPKGSFRVVVP